MKKSLINLSFLKYYQLFGSVLGFIISFYLIKTTIDFTDVSVKDYLSLTLLFSFFIFNLYSAILLFQKKNLIGLKLIIISLLLQIVGFNIAGLFYTAINGIAVNFTIDMTKDFIVGFEFQFSQFLLSSVTDNNIVVFKINFLAIFLLFYVSNKFNKLKIL